MSWIENVGTSNYNGLQVGLTRRYQPGVQFGVAYTWSKALGVGSSDGETLSRFLSRKVWNYGLAYYDQTHMFIVNYLWDLPKASRVAPSAVVRWAFDNWQLSGITNVSSGLPQSVNFTTVDNADITGGGDGVRPVVVAPIPLSRSERGFSRWFNTAAFARPAQGTFGNAAIRVYRGPGISNWDMNL
ncbi:MAG TPA: hypothetical protein VFL57_14945, partial [Bryobacteraceae bacterium]|nr:hypothetical protein [Bryobacteraceae bacterium]